MKSYFKPFPDKSGKQVKLYENSMTVVSCAIVICTEVVQDALSTLAETKTHMTFLFIDGGPVDVQKSLSEFEQFQASIGFCGQFVHLVGI